MYTRMKLSRGILPLLLAIALLFPQSAFAAGPGIPDYDGAAATELKRNVPSLAAEDIDAREHVTYSPLDALGRPGPVTACLGRASLPSGLRSDDVGALPVGWVTVRYADGYLYSLCHLLSPALGGDASAAENVFTGTRYLQNESMRLYEDRIADCLARTAYHVLYRATPVYSGDNLVAEGVQLEALSVEDGGRTVCFNVFLYNIQPGVTIDYRTGESVQDAEMTVEFTAKELLALHLFPEPPQMLAPQHGSFDALSEAFINSSGIATSQLSTKMLLWVSKTGDKYHSVNPCGNMDSDGARQVTVDLTTIRASQLCETCCQSIISALPSLKASLSGSSASSGGYSSGGNITHISSADFQDDDSPYSSGGHITHVKVTPTPRPVLTPAPTEKPQSPGNSLLSGILSSALSTDNTMVWISGMDHCYHSTDSCTNVDAASAYQKTLDWAKASGYTPCGECW